MESMNKFKVLTIIIICLFMFAIAAMYTNTKDVSEGKAKQSAQNPSRYEEQTRNKEKLDFTDLMYSLDALQHRVEELEAKTGNVSSQTSGSSDLNCSIYGSKTLRGIEPLSPNAAVQDAQINGNDLVITCSLR